MLPRLKFLSKIRDEFLVHQICALIGPRQSGKTTLAKAYLKELDTQQAHFFDCENPLHIARLDNPMLAMQGLKGLIIIDEVQLRPDLFPVLRVLVDEDPGCKFLITGSASRDLLQQSSET
jgi:predicted AAA+ superfamily ATPase